MAGHQASGRSPDKEKIAGAVEETLRANIFANRYALHPSQVGDIVDKLSDSIITFVSNGDTGPVKELGGTLERMGLSIESVMAAVAVLDDLSFATEKVNSYASALVSGFSSSREAEILTSQEQLRRALSSALETQSRELLIKNQAIDSSMNGIVIADMRGRIAYVNRSFLTMWGYDSAERLEGRLIRDIWSDDDARAIVERFTRAGEWRGEYAAERVDGVVLTVSVSTSYIRNAKGDSIGIMAFFVDITESKHLEIQMQQIQKMDDLGQLAGGIVHDFNNLLAAIGGYLQLVLLDTPSGGSIRRDLLQIKSAVDRGAGLTKQLSYFTRQASGRREVINLNDVAMETYELLKHTFPSDIEIRLSLSDSPWRIEADPNQMSQVMMNLCVNARDAIVEKRGSEGRGTIGRVTIETANVELTESEAKQYVHVEAGRYVQLRVEDTGTGIAPEVRRRLFVPFVTTKNSTGGTGLGLAVVYGIVRSNRGFIDLTSAQGIGTTFFVYVPVAKRLLDADPVTDEEPGLVHGEGTVLVVDDDAQVREVIGRALKLSGYDVLEASSGRGALGLYREQGEGIDLIVLDMIMPEMNGQETLDRLHEIDPNAAVLLMTGYTTGGRLGRLARDGAADVIEKPIDLRLLTEMVSKRLQVDQ